jgi:hypothetical protein
LEIIEKLEAVFLSDSIFARQTNLIPVVPVSSRVHFQEATIPKQGGIVLDLARMNRVLEIDELNRRVRIEAGGHMGTTCRDGIRSDLSY